MKFLNRKNPYNWSTRIYNKNSGKDLRKILEDSNAENIKLIQDTTVGILYYFELSKPTKIFENILPKGQYILKKQSLDDDNDLEKDKEINYFLQLSKHKLIPHIFEIETFKQLSVSESKFPYWTFIFIMKYVDAIDLEKLYIQRKWNLKKNNDLQLRNFIWDRILKEYGKWKSLQFAHNDLQLKNILLDKKGNIIFIDPIFDEFRNYDKPRLELIKEMLFDNTVSIGW